MTGRLSWHDYFINIAKVTSERATCNRRKVGAVLVKDRRILATGYNGSPPGEPHCNDVGCQMENGHCARTIHAEANAVAQAARFGISIEGARLYCTLEPCPTCAKLLQSAGVLFHHWAEAYGSPAQ